MSRRRPRPDWRVAFMAAIDAHRPHPFAWGKHDCGILAADCIKAVTGRDIAKNIRGHYRCQQTAAAFLAMCGYRSSLHVVARHFPRIPIAFARAGDIAVVRTEQGPALAPVMGAEIAAYRADGVLGVLPLEAATFAFRIQAEE